MISQGQGFFIAKRQETIEQNSFGTSFLLPPLCLDVIILSLDSSSSPSLLLLMIGTERERERKIYYIGKHYITRRRCRERTRRRRWVLDVH